ncbi:undecaprenyl/decaprenyl-phosphate alpha-N-acetylglucosaminyl 1-phosphate transferase [Virgibacillus necropolis]|uniref:glycosyltransferase family 4 protein n=1 Tax=Virgibacillus necropolis TaxID=163877 RepID=UPI00384A9537
MFTILLLASLTLVISLIITPLIIKLAIKLNATDKPNYRKAHKVPTPTLGGIAIFLSFVGGLFILQPYSDYHAAVVTGASIIIVLGIIDDLYNLSAKIKFSVQIVVALLVVYWGGLQVEFINLPFGGQIEFGFLSSIVAIFWIVGITNAINLIDGLDGLAAGVSSIALFTIAGMAVLMGDVYVSTMALILFFSTMGFLRYNFFPAKIFMGDTGAMFLGFMISVLALLGFKNITVISFVIPIFILGVPISDTLIAMVRRRVNRQPISQPDKSHLHHRLMQSGFTHKQTVLFIYSLSAMFSISAIFFSMTTLWGSIIILGVALLAIEVLIESLGLINNDFKPLTNFVKSLWEKS